MRAVLKSLSQMAVMAAIVATLAYFPLGLLATLAFRLFGIPFDALVTFGGALGMFLGLVSWWLVAFAGACAYAAWMFPWGDAAFAWPSRK